MTLRHWAVTTGLYFEPQTVTPLYTEAVTEADKEELLVFWGLISDSTWLGTKGRVSGIRDPLYRYLHRLISTSIAPRLKSREWCTDRELSFFVLPPYRQAVRPIHMPHYLFCVCLYAAEVRDFVWRRVHHSYHVCAYTMACAGSSDVTGHSPCPIRPTHDERHVHHASIPAVERMEDLMMWAVGRLVDVSLAAGIEPPPLLPPHHYPDDPVQDVGGPGQDDGGADQADGGAGQV
ncbi:hypothetical protein L1987_80884 [Smallanthus sonchifolius]|uniref:Uncharacterized protein n=1 Tax=Smallanthus sonchifolius TaxID=185202 RepID=A0ACB8YQ09_9ASTR|nr:hypothetical protein L1987_80884 [Smallanthus sonchifolius]